MKSFFEERKFGAAARKQPLIESMRSIDEGQIAAPAISLNKVASIGDVSVVEPPPLTRKHVKAITERESPDGFGDRRSLLVPAETPFCSSQQQYTPPVVETSATFEAGMQAAAKQDVARPTATLSQCQYVTIDPSLIGEHSRSVDEEDQEQRRIANSNNKCDNDSNVPFSCFPQRQRIDTDDEIETKIPAENAAFSVFQNVFVKTGLIYALIVAITAAGMVYGVSDKLKAFHYIQHADVVMDLQVAFLGNAYLFVNDVPRLLEAISEGHVYQNSCLHAGGSLSDLWITGNGMYTLWHTDEATLTYSTGDDEYSESLSTYDYGLCSVTQILQGYDEYIAYGNAYGTYYSDGLNPCLIDTDYATFVKAELERDPVHWDYVVMVEQTKRTAIEDARNDTVQALLTQYGPLLKTSGAIPVIVDTHAFWSSKSNMTGLTDIPTFTAMITDGVAEFTAALTSVLPKKQAPLVAPIGLAYLTVWEENFDLWEKLFLDDQIHSSIYGSYMLACVLYATLFGDLPEIPESIPALFMDARKIVGQPTYPSSDDADYLRAVAGRVVLSGYVPPSLLAVYANRRRRR